MRAPFYQSHANHGHERACCWPEPPVTRRWTEVDISTEAPLRAEDCPWNQRNILRSRLASSLARYPFNNLCEPFDRFASQHVIIYQPENALRHIGIRGEQDYRLMRELLFDLVCNRFSVDTFVLVFH